MKARNRSQWIIELINASTPRFLDAMAEFKIHSQLLLDAHCLGRFPSAHVLLHKNAIVPWFILVPETEIADLLDLPEELRQAVMRDAAAIPIS